VKLDNEFGGHIVTGHVDAVGEVVSIARERDSVRLQLDAPLAPAPYLAAKGSLTVDGVSLTINDIEDRANAYRIGINLVPHTQAMTTSAISGRPERLIWRSISLLVTVGG